MNILVKKATDLDELLLDYFVSKKVVYLLKLEKRIKVNGKTVINKLQLQVNDEIEIDLFKPEENAIETFDYSIDILYEDDCLLIVNKPVDMLIYDDNKSDCLDNCIANYYQKTNQKHKVYHLHRLDKDTSGCIIYCKEPYLLAKLDNMLATKQIERTYLALVEGKISHKMTINQPIGKDRHINNKYRISNSGKSAVTVVEPIKYANNTTLVKCKLKTGRTHQIRVHLSSISHPIIGDLIYGQKRAPRLMLHSYSVRFIHPLNNQLVTVKCKCPF
ncbi:MAG: RluA family pseudouridine synthase [Erysipelotrichaceae bacterium]